MIAKLSEPLCYNSLFFLGLILRVSIWMLHIYFLNLKQQLIFSQMKVQMKQWTMLVMTNLKVYVCKLNKNTLCNNFYSICFDILINLFTLFL